MKLLPPKIIIDLMMYLNETSKPSPLLLENDIFYECLYQTI